ncbi:c-type cytochrome [Methylophaga sp. OBS1]|uniref:c-type cytochrome n=1 Tax=Methylophaga sp. OBS1 TaxID=2991933 RepID=UPI00225B22AE|nr:cytochrome c [Methylophaga sp. OBS1]MCX4191236.1 cytochrome c [Methylophaga sp. OBS1]MCX4191818.1 cytochrome c [Methylophaga sp. OBS1]
MNKSKIRLLFYMPVLLTHAMILSGCDQPTENDSSSQINNEVTDVSPAEPMAEQQPSQESSSSPEVNPPEQHAEPPAPSSVTQAESSASSEEKQSSDDLYQVVDGNKLDEFSYEGFKLYRNWCARCHGTYGQGMVGPNLADSLNVISKAEFVDVVTHGKTGQIGSMPAWESNATVMSGMENLYAYLKARADGAIGEVKPAKQQ